MTEKKSRPLGVLLINLGTPDAPTASAIRRYLSEFLSDRRVIGIPRIIWLPILHGFILPFRPRKLVERYAAIWGQEDAPIRIITAELARKVESSLMARQIDDILVRSAMTYGEPSIKSVLDDLQQSGSNEILIIPLFPQYSSTTTAAVFDKLAGVVSKLKVLPNIRYATDYHQDQKYIHAITKSIEARVSDFPPGNRLIFSFHGLPEIQIKQGDPYRSQCETTANIIASNLGLVEDQWQLTFQSRFGPAKWLQPYTSEVLMGLPANGVKQVTVVCPGFAVDCLETLEEVDMLNREIFMNAGGESYTYIPALNAENPHVELMTELVCERLFRREHPDY